MIYFTSFDDKIGFTFYIVRNSFILQKKKKILASATTKKSEIKISD